MAASERPKSKLAELARENYRQVISGILLGAVGWLVFPTIASLLRKGNTAFIRELTKAVVWPGHIWALVVVIISATVILCAASAISFSRRLFASWRAEPGRGLFWIWALAAAFALSFLSGSRYLYSLLSLALSVAISRLLVITASTPAILKKATNIDPDLPIESRTQDILDRQAVVSDLIEQVISGVAPVAAVVGSYGVGKTSVLNLLKEALRSNYRDIVTVSFISSLATNDQVLVGTLFNSIAKELQKRFVLERLPQGFARYGGFLVSTVPRFGGTLKEMFRVPSQEDQIRQVKRSLERLNVRVVVIDDMDRMDEKELQVLLKLMRGGGEFSNLTYVCAFDKEALVRQVSASRMSSEMGREYLEKYFPVQISLPKIDGGILAREFDNKFETLCRSHGLLRTEQEQKEFNENFGPLWQIHIYRCFSNLRRIKLFFNRVIATMGPVAEEINPMDFILLEIIREAAPTIYEHIYVNRRYFYYAPWMIETWAEKLSPNEQQATDRRKQFLEKLEKSLDSDKRELVIELLSELFPLVKESRGLGLGAEPDPLRSKKERRIFHPAFFGRYFIYGVQADQFGEAAFSRLASDLNNSTSIEECKRHVSDEFESLGVASRKRWNFLDQISIKIDRFGALQAEAVALAIAALSDRLEPPILGLAEADTARRIVFSVANTFANSAKAQVLLENVIRTATADFFAALVLSACEDPKKNQILTEWRNINLDILSASFRQRMRTKYCPGAPASMFEGGNQTGALACLRLWLRTGGKNEIRSYLRDEFATRPPSLGKMIYLAFPTNESASEDELRGLSDLYSLRELESSLEISGSGAFLSAEEGAAIARFKEILASVRMPKLRFKLAKDSVWSATKKDGSALECVNDQVIDAIKIRDSGLPSEQIFRDAVAAGVAEVVPPPSWLESEGEGSNAAVSA